MDLFAWILVAAALALALIGIARFALHRAIYPGPDSWRRNATPADEGFAESEIVELVASADGGRTRAWFLPQPARTRATRPTIVHFHGNGGSLQAALWLARQLWERVDANVLLVEYRGYSNDDRVSAAGSPNERALTADATAAVEWLLARADIDHARIFLHGHSLGGAIAVQVARIFRSRVAGVVLENSFTSMLDAAMAVGVSFSSHVALLRPIVRALLPSRWPSLATIGEISAPILFLSGLRDTVIPPAHMRALHDGASASRLRRLVEFDDGTHDETSFASFADNRFQSGWRLDANQRYFDSVRTFIGDASASRGGKSRSE